VLGAFQNIKIARDMIVRLILGSPPGKVYNMMRNIASRQRDRF
jgi:RNA-binding protein PNO1